MMAERKTNAEMLKEVNAKLDQLIGGEDNKASGKKSTAASAKSGSKTAAKKPAAKKPAEKKPAAKSTASKPAASKSTEKKPAAKKAAPKQVKPAEEKAEEEVASTVAEEPAPTPAPAPAEEPTPEPVAAQQTPEEPKAEVEQSAPAKESEPEVKKEEPVAPVNASEAPAKTEEEPPKEEKANKKNIAGKTDDFIKGKGKLPIFIVVNSLFFISSLLLLLVTFNVTDAGNATHGYNLFTYFTKSAEVKGYLKVMAGDWANGGYVMIGILMWLAFLLPLALAVKNLIIALTKKNYNVYKFDAIVAFAFMLGYLAVINLFGTNVTAGQMIAFIVSAADLAFTLLCLFITKSVKSLPFFSLVNILLAMITVFLLVGPAAKTAAGDPIYAAKTASIASAGGFFVMLLFAILALIALIIMQIKRFPKIVEIAVPLAAAVFAIISMIILGVQVKALTAPYAGAKVAGGYVFGAVLTILIAIADTVFTFVKPLKKFKKMVDDSDDGTGKNITADTAEPAPAAATATATAAPEQSAQAPKAEPAPETAEKAPQAEAQDKKFCTACGAQNAPDAAFCCKCGHKF